MSDSITSGLGDEFALSGDVLGLRIKTPRGSRHGSQPDPNVAFVDSARAIFASQPSEPRESRRESTRETRTATRRRGVQGDARATSSLPSLSGHVGDTLAGRRERLDGSGLSLPAWSTLHSADPTVASMTQNRHEDARVQLLKAGTARVSVVSGGQVATATGQRITP